MPRTSNLTMLNAIPFYELPVQTLLRDDPANFTPTPFNGYSINELLFSPILLSLVTSVESYYLKKGKCTSRALFQIIQAGNGGQQPILPISLFFFFFNLTRPTSTLLHFDRSGCSRCLFGFPSVDPLFYYHRRSKLQFVSSSSNPKARERLHETRFTLFFFFLSR